MKRSERYEILATIQDGTLATSYKARDRVLDRLVLLKVLHPQQSLDADLVQRFRREALLQARLKHPHIVTVYDFGSEDDFYIASEFVEGCTLDDKLEEKGRLTFEELRPIVAQVVQALNYAHQQGVVHRDLKPANIMIASSGEARLTDFGLAFARDFGALTQEGCVIGTPAYMSPEQARGKQTDARTDIFSLGILIYQALSGTNPFQAETCADALSLVLNREPKPLEQLVPGLPELVTRLVGGMLVKNQEQRRASLREVAEVFNPGTSPPSLPLSDRRDSSLRSERQGAKGHQETKKPSGFIGVHRWVPMALSGLAVLLALFFVLRAASGKKPARGAGVISPKIGGVPISPESIVPDRGWEAAPTTEPEADISNVKSAIVRVHPRFQSESMPPAQPRCRLKIAVVPWAEVAIDGKSVGITPFSTPVELTQGPHEITLRNSYFPVVTKSVVLNDSVSSVSYHLEEGLAQVDLRVTPWALVTIDGQFIDTTPISRPISLRLGEHTILLQHPVLGARTEKVRTDSARIYRFTFDMARR
jgi:serine/threonine protein kinase